MGYDSQRHRRGRDVQGQAGVRVAVAPEVTRRPEYIAGQIEPEAFASNRGPRVFERSHRGEVAGLAGGGASPGARGFVGSRSGCRPTATRTDRRPYDAFYLSRRTARRRPGTPEPLGPVTSRIQTGPGPACGARPRRLRGVRRSPAGHVDQDQDRGARRAGTAIRHDQATAVLIVNDVKSGPSGKGGVALWIGPGTVRISESRGDA